MSAVADFELSCAEDTAPDELSARDGASRRADDLPSGFIFSDAFRALYAEHFALVWRGLLRLGVPRAQLEDAVQDVFLVVHRREDEFAGRSKIKTWVYGIVVRVAKDYRRADARHKRRIQRWAEWFRSEPAPSPVEQVEQREAARLVHRALNRLEDEQREVLVLVELEELPLREVAEMLELQLRTCQRRLKQARERFERELDKLLRPTSNRGGASASEEINP